MPLHALADLSNATAASQAEMEAGTETALRVMSPLRVSQAITALGGGGSGGIDGGTPESEYGATTPIDGGTP